MSETENTDPFEWMHGTTCGVYHETGACGARCEHPDFCPGSTTNQTKENNMKTRGLSKTTEKRIYCATLSIATETADAVAKRTNSERESLLLLRLGRRCAGEVAAYIAPTGCKYVAVAHATTLFDKWVGHCGFTTEQILTDDTKEN